jgi:hypothetical protein
LKVNAVEAIECLHSWRKSGLINSVRKQVEELWEDMTMLVDVEDENSQVSKEG